MIYPSQKWFLVSMLVCATSLSGCLQKQNSPKHSVPINSGENTASNTCVTKAATNSAHTIETSVGQAFCIVISSNITTGYAWEYLPSLDSNKVKLIEKHYQPPETNRLGAAGMEFLTFRAQGNGKVEISLIYRRSWQTDEQPVMTRKFNVLIKSM